MNEIIKAEEAIVRMFKGEELEVISLGGEGVPIRIRRGGVELRYDDDWIRNRAKSGHWLSRTFRVPVKTHTIEFGNQNGTRAIFNDVCGPIKIDGKVVG